MPAASHERMLARAASPMPVSASRYPDRLTPIGAERTAAGTRRVVRFGAQHRPQRRRAAAGDAEPDPRAPVRFEDPPGVARADRRGL